MARLGPARSFSEEFKRRAVQRMETENIQRLARELGVSRRSLYVWERKLKGQKQPGKRPLIGQEATPSAVEQGLREEIKHLQEALGKRALEVDFFKGALQKIEARRRSKGGSGETASTPKSGN